MYPGESNVITISLVCSVRLEEGTWIKISGFQGARPQQVQTFSVDTDLLASSSTTPNSVGLGE